MFLYPSLEIIRADAFRPKLPESRNTIETAVRRSSTYELNPAQRYWSMLPSRWISEIKSFQGNCHRSIRLPIRSHGPLIWNPRLRRKLQNIIAPFLLGGTQKPPRGGCPIGMILKWFVQRLSPEVYVYKTNRDPKFPPDPDHSSKFCKRTT